MGSAKMPNYVYAYRGTVDVNAPSPPPRNETEAANMGSAKMPKYAHWILIWSH